MARSRSGRIVCADCANSIVCPDWEFIRSVVSKGGACEAPIETGGCGLKVPPGETVYIMDDLSRVTNRRVEA